jgi:hypothetical protein
VSEALERDQPRSLDGIFPGSWIDANFDVWIGADEDNKAWEYLLRARQKYDEAAPGVDEAGRRLAYEELMIAEGSDWCWWYGPEHHSENRREFDELYREHLANIYRALKQPPPDELSRPILTLEASDLHQPPANSIHPVIDGEVTSYFEWMGAGRYRTDNRYGAMHGQPLLVRELYYGADDSNLYLRLDFENSAEFSKIELRMQTALISLLDTPEVEFAHREILEIRVPFHLLGTSKDRTLQFQLALTNHELPLDVIPTGGTIDFNPNANSE